MTEHGHDSSTMQFLERRSHLWYVGRFLGVFLDELDDRLLAQGSELLRSRKVVDCMIQPGMATARVYDEGSAPRQMELLFEPLSNSDWERLFERLARSSLFMAMMLSGELPFELEQVCQETGVSFFPETITGVAVRFDGAAGSIHSPYFAALILRLAEKLDADAFSLFLLRGCGREETMLKLRTHRSSIRSDFPLIAHETRSPLPIHAAPSLQESIQHFWSLGADISQLTYRIRADELPASILKWLDPLPLGGLEEYMDFALEAAYEKVARLAQGFGLGMW